MKIAVAFSLPFLLFSAPVEDLRLISTSESEASLMTESQVFDLIRDGTRFIDLTDASKYGDENIPPVDNLITAFPKVHAQSVVKSLSSRISLSKMTTFLKEFSSFHTRYYKSDFGKKSSAWLQQQLESIASHASKRVSVTVIPFQHPWGQSSVIARLSSNSGSFNDAPVTIVSAHQDSINGRNPKNGRAPGADDDGSGATTVIEAFRVLVEQGFEPATPIEFHFYSGEEAGLLGSQRVANDYKKRGVLVKGAFQVDMTGYIKPGTKPVIGVSTDNVNAAATQFLRDLAVQYCDIDYVNTKCGYGCSDHVSWTRAGYPSAFTFESLFDDHSPYIHSVEDTVEHVSFEHIAEFTKLVLGWAVELSS